MYNSEQADDSALQSLFMQQLKLTWYKNIIVKVFYISHNGNVNDDIDIDTDSFQTEK